MPPTTITFILGPTAGGKSGLALAYASDWQNRHQKPAVIINCDAMQLYQALEIITARPTRAQTQTIPHELYGVIAADHLATAAWWRGEALRQIDHYRATHKIIIVGGTGLYANSLISGLSPIPDIAPRFRAEAQKILQSSGLAAFHHDLATIDPASAQKIRATDSQRMIRAVEIFLATGKPLSYFQALPKLPPPDYLQFKTFVVAPPRGEIYDRINRRVHQMIAQNALAEIAAVKNADPTLPMMKAIGVKQLIDHLNGGCALEAAIISIQSATRAYAKRQMTWFRHQLPMPIWLESADMAENLSRLIALDEAANLN